MVAADNMAILFLQDWTVAATERHVAALILASISRSMLSPDYSCPWRKYWI